MPESMLIIEQKSFVDIINPIIDVCRQLKMCIRDRLIDVLPLDILPVCQFLEVGEKIPFHLGFVKEAVVLVEDGRRPGN